MTKITAGTSKRRTLTTLWQRDGEGFLAMWPNGDIERFNRMDDLLLAHRTWVVECGREEVIQHVLIERS